MSDKEAESDLSEFQESLRGFRALREELQSDNDAASTIRKMGAPFGALRDQNAFQQALAGMRRNQVSELNRTLEAFNTNSAANFRKAIEAATKNSVPQFPTSVLEATHPTIGTDVHSTPAFNDIEPAPVANSGPTKITPEEAREAMQKGGLIVECPGCGRPYLVENADFDPAGERGDESCSRCRDADKGFQ